MKDSQKINIRLGAMLKGWKNFVTQPQVSEKTAKMRALICGQCPHAKKGMLLTFVKDSLKEIEGHYCAACGCPLSAKLRSDDTCPEGKWE